MTKHEIVTNIVFKFNSRNYLLWPKYFLWFIFINKDASNKLKLYKHHKKVVSEMWKKYDKVDLRSEYYKSKKTP